MVYTYMMYKKTILMMTKSIKVDLNTVQIEIKQVLIKQP